MRNFVDLLNANAGVISLGFALVVAAATVFYALLTSRLVEETRLMRKAHTLPHVAARVEPHPEFLHAAMLIIENRGAGPAHCVTLSVQPDFQLRPGTQLSSVGLFKYGIRYLAAGQSISMFLTSLIGEGAEIEKPDGRFAVTINAKYQDAFGDEHNHSFPLDFLHIVGLTHIGTPAIRSIADDLTKLRENLGHFVTGFRRLHVETFDARDRREEASEREASRRQQISDTATDAGLDAPRAPEAGEPVHEA